MRAQEVARRLRPLIVKASASLSDTDALQAVELFDEWLPDTDYSIGDRRRYEGVLYKARQAHTSQEIYPPNIVPALWEVVAPEGKGDSPDNPIEYDQSMAIEEGKFYIENDVIYICTRNSVNPLYTALANVIGNYVEVFVGN
ncbi:MAG: hypothetical protein IKS01_00565 [Paludibacteraceae bacterium]|nr:hypothetical protein [Paludibacteraceae bacterium]